MSIWAILLAIAGIVLAMNLLVVALCTVAARADSVSERLNLQALEEELAAGEDAARSIARPDAGHR